MAALWIYIFFTYWLLELSFQQELDATQTNILESSTPDQTTVNDAPFMEQHVIGPFKVWHVGGFVIAGLTTILIGVCCMIDLRVPRTKEEIEANYERRQAAHKYIDKLGKLDFKGVQTKSQAVMQKEKEMTVKQKAVDKQNKKEEKEKTADTKGRRSGGRATPLQPNMSMATAYSPASMMGMFSGYPGMMPMQGMPGQQTPGASSQQAGSRPGTLPRQGGQFPMMNPMMNPMMMNMWRSQSLSNLQAMNSPMLSRANSVTALNKDQNQTPKMKRLVQRLMKAKEEEREEEEREGKTNENQTEENDDKPALKPGERKKWGKK